MIGEADPRWSCNRKRRYATKEYARAALKRVLERGLGEGQAPYACTHCGGWHLGHPRRS